MDLKSLFLGNKMIRPYDRERHEALIFAMMDSSPMKLPGFDLIYDRRPEFEALLKLQAPSYLTIVGEDGNELLGCFSLSWGPRYVNGEIKTVSYLGDFRIQSPRMAAKLWRTTYPEFIAQSLKRGIDHHLTAILKDNHAAIRNLVYSGRSRGFHYRYLKTLEMVNSFGLKPLKRVRAAFQLEQGGTEQEIQSFLDLVHRNKLFGYVFGSKEWEFRKKNWPAWDLQKFLVVRGKQNKILAACLPWAPSKAKRMRAENIKWPMSIFLQGLKIIGISAPILGQEIEALYLTHLAFSEELVPRERAQIVAQFLVQARATHGNRYQMISFADEENLRQESALRGFFQQVTGVNLYSVLPSQTSDDRAWPKSSHDQSIGFEMALV